ncbi:MAG: SPOR domain-containing protein [Candidatus Paracaedibacteraceae bacterium]|nr:SPOR domain-containing protein [Candidatus Paracaedibacteraceae bacterium]
MQHDNFENKAFKRPHQTQEPFFEEVNPYGETEKWWWIFQNPLGVIILLALAILLIIGLWFIFQPSSKQPGVSSNVMVIKADVAPYKEAPDETANTTVENQDKEVYKRLNQNPDDQQDTTEALVVEQEKPLEVQNLPDETKNMVKERAAEKQNNLRKLNSNTGIKMPEPVMNEKFISEKKREVLPSKTEEKVEVKTEVQKKVEKPKISNALNPGVYAIRVASFRKMETAEREMNRVFSALGKAFNGVGRVVKRIESDSGVFYVVNIGAFSSLSKAKEAAKLLREKNFSAIIQKVSG